MQQKSFVVREQDANEVMLRKSVMDSKSFSERDGVLMRDGSLGEVQNYVDDKTLLWKIDLLIMPLL